MEQNGAIWPMERLFADLHDSAPPVVEPDDSSWPAADALTLQAQRALLEVADDLRQVANGTVPLTDAFVMLAHYQQEQARIAADLDEREVWALTAILKVSEPLWACLSTPTLHFTLDRAEADADSHLEVGHFAHLADLLWPSADEQALVAATSVGWARVYPHDARRAAGQAGALAYSYVPIPQSEALRVLGFGTIIHEIEVVTHMAASLLLRQAESQWKRQAQLAAVEHAVGWEPEPVPRRATQALAAPRSPDQLVLGREPEIRWLRGSAYGGLLVAVFFAVNGFPPVATAMLLTALCLWLVSLAARAQAGELRRTEPL